MPKCSSGLEPSPEGFGEDKALYSSSDRFSFSLSFDSSGTAAVVSSTKHRLGKRTHHQFRPSALPISTQSAWYTPAGKVKSPYCLTGKYRGSKVTVTFAGGWFAASPFWAEEYISSFWERRTFSACYIEPVFFNAACKEPIISSRIASFNAWSVSESLLAIT